MGLSILEVSHRSPQFSAVIDEAVQLVKELLNLDDRYEVLFLTGGASTQFFYDCNEFITARWYGLLCRYRQLVFQSY